MKISEIYNHRSGFEIIKSMDGIMDDLHEILTNTLQFGRNPTSEIKFKVGDGFNHLGWADKVNVGNTNLTINFMKGNAGVCFQIGNTARTYADILKICQLHHKETISAGVIIVPNSVESKMLGSNYASFERITKDLSQLVDVVISPILIIGLSN